MRGDDSLSDLLARAEAQGIVTGAQRAALAALAADMPAPAPASAAPAAGESRVESPAAPAARFDFVHVLWYLGALIAMGAMGLFATTAFGAMGPGALCVIGVAYALLFWKIGDALWRRALKVPGGLLVAAAVSMVPLIVFGAQARLGWFGPYGEPGQYQDFYEWVKGGWLLMELSTLVAALVAARFYPFGFIAAIAAVALWFLSMDATPWIFRVQEFTWEQRADVSVGFGLAFMALAWGVDLMQKRADFAYWLHLAAALAFWGGLTSMHAGNEFGRFVYCLINLALIGFAVFLGRRVYAVFGGLGVMLYLGYLAYDEFKDSLLFPFALSAFGLAMVGLGVVALRSAPRFEKAMDEMLPEALKRLRPARG